MPPKEFLKQVADYCWSHNFLDVFHKFFKDHAEAFIGAPEMTGGEHNMEYYALFQNYLAVYEDTLTDYLATLDHSIEDFYAEVRNTQDESMDPYLRTFIDCLLASADYESFYKVMVREGKKRATVLKMQEHQRQAEDKVSTTEEQQDPAEGKGVAIEVADEKSSFRGDDEVADAKSPEAKGGDFK